MRGVLSAAVVIGSALFAPALVRADDEADMKALIEKAIKAHGGAEKLTKHKTVQIKIKGKVYAVMCGLEYTGEMSVQLPGQVRSDISFTIMGMNFTVIQALNGDKGWTSINGKVDDLSKEAIAEAKEGMYFQWVASLYPLTEKEFTFAPLGESKVGDKEAVGVKVSRKDHRDMNLYFDKKTNLLLKIEHQAKDVMAGTAEFNQETFYEDYKEADGMQRANKILIKRDGKDYVDAETTEYKALDKLDDKEFDKPKD
jgi:hypothetical protein